MTRSEKAALSDAQLALGTACETMLASDKYQRANPVTYTGLVKRLAMLPEHGLPRMRVVPQSKLEELGRIPRSNENFQVDALEAVKRLGADGVDNSPKAVLLFYSHRWKRPNWCEALGQDLPWGSLERQQAMAEGKVFGDPDDAERSKAKDLIEFGKWFKRACKSYVDETGGITGASDLEIHWWIDWACTNQDEPGPDMAALPAYAAVCHGIVAAWNDVYKDRAWCQVELLMSYAFMTTGNKVWVVPPGFGDGATRPLKLEKEKVVVADPAKGQLTNDGDRPVIESLTGVASRSTAFSCWRTFVNNSTHSVFLCCGLNVCCCCMWCGLCPLVTARTVRPGQSEVEKLVPLGSSLVAPSNEAMERGGGAAAADHTSELRLLLL